MHQALGTSVQQTQKGACFAQLPSIDASKVWVIFGVLGFWIFHVIAERQVTSILTLSVYAQALSFNLLRMQISTSKSVEGISAKALIMQVVKLCCRLSTTLWLDGYLPTDKSGDWIYQVGDVLSLLMVLQILYCVLVLYKATYQRDQDSVDVQNLIMGASVLAVLIHPSQHAHAPLDILWTAHLYIDALAMIPQLWMISKAGGRVRGLTS